MAHTQRHDGSSALDESQIHRLLRHGEITECQQLPWGSNYTFAVTLEAEGVGQALAIYKPRRGETPLWDFPDESLYRREYSAYVFSRLLGWNFVPPTVARDGPHGIGSVQLYIEPDDSIDYAGIQEKHADQLMRIAVFDVIANNADRKASHCLLDGDGRLWGIDHGLTFNVVPKLRTVIWEFRGQPIPDGIMADLVDFCGNSERSQSARSFLETWLSRQEAAATLKRLDRVIVEGRFPPPDPSGRNVPWPPY